MKLRWKITLTVVTGCCLNLLLLVGYYNILLPGSSLPIRRRWSQSLNQTAQPDIGKAGSGRELSDGDGKLYQGGSNPPH